MVPRYLGMTRDAARDLVDLVTKRDTGCDAETPWWKSGVLALFGADVAIVVDLVGGLDSFWTAIAIGAIGGAVVTFVLRLLFPDPEHAHCDECNLCSIRDGVATSHDSADLDAKLIAAGWAVVTAEDAQTKTYCRCVAALVRDMQAIDG